MRIVGILNWYDERPAMLAACVASLARAGVDHLVAVDGAYALYPGGRPSSPVEQHDAILGVCRGAGIGCTLHVPPHVYVGDEVEKRTLGFRLAEQVTTENDWYFLMDADQVIVSALALGDALANSRLDVGEVRFRDEQSDPAALGGFPVRCVFRAIRGLHLHGNHCTYRTPDGRYLWLNVPADREPAQEPAVDLSFVEVEHRPSLRSHARHQAKTAFYERRDRLGVEKAVA